MVEIPAADDPRVYIPIDIPVKAGKTLSLRVPRFDFMTEHEYDAMMTALKAVDDSGEQDGYKQARATSLAMLKQFVPAAQYKQCEQLVTGQLIAIRQHWMDQSGISLGEYLRSAESSTSPTSAGQSDTTSIAPAGDAATSDAA